MIVVDTSAIVAIVLGEDEREAFLQAEADAAYAAFVVFGTGSGHPAALNFGDLFSYALAKTRGLPLLFKGDDFTRTDLQRPMLAANDPPT